MPRLAQGDLVNLTGQRTPLSIAYDAAADLLVRMAISSRGAWQVRVITSGDVAEDKGGLTAWERAFEQACYYHRRIYRHGTPYYVHDAAGRIMRDADGRRLETPNPDRTHALKVEWSPRVRRSRVIAIRVHSIGEASVYASEHAGELNAEAR